MVNYQLSLKTWHIKLYLNQLWYNCQHKSTHVQKIRKSADEKLSKYFSPTSNRAVILGVCTIEDVGDLLNLFCPTREALLHFNAQIRLRISAQFASLREIVIRRVYVEFVGQFFITQDKRLNLRIMRLFTIAEYGSFAF